jgi:branched-chain amino acid transport system substrate-binding protein
VTPEPGRTPALRVALLLILALSAAACGPRFDRDLLTQQSDVDLAAGPGAPADGTTVDTGAPGTVDSAPQDGAPAAPGDTTPFTPAGPDTAGTDTGPVTTGGTGTRSGGTTAAAAGPQPGLTGNTIKIGYLVPLTGAAPIPTSWDDGANLYWNVKNDTGGINGRKVQLIIEDTESSTTTAVNKARKLVTQDKVFTIVTLDRLEVQEKVAQFLEQVGMPHVMVQSPASPPASWKNTFTISIDHAVQGRAIAQFWAADLGAGGGKRKVGFVREQTSALKPGTDAFEAEAKRLGLQVVARETINPQQVDFSQTVLRLRQSGAEVVWLYMAPTPAATIIGQSGSAGYRPTWFANSISWGFELMHGVTGGFMEGAYAFSPWVSLSHPRAKTYKDAWARKIGGTADDIGLVGWGVGGVLDAALSRPGRNLGWDSFRASMRTFRAATDVWVPLDFSGGGSIGTRRVAVFKAQGGAWQTVGDFRSF